MKKLLNKLEGVKRFIVRPFVLPPVETVGVRWEDFKKRLANGEFRNRIVFGVSDKLKDFYVVDPLKSPGICAVGSMGSGKSGSLSTITQINRLSNSDNTLTILLDPSKGMGDYAMMFGEKGVVKALNDTGKFISIVDLIFREMRARSKEFASLNNIKHIEDYEAATGKSIARIILVIEEFHAISTDAKINLHQNIDVEGTAAFQMAKMMREGRSFGIQVALATQRATYDDIPTSLKPGINTWLVFKMNDAGSVSASGVQHADQVPANTKGRCAYEDGFLQVPYLTAEGYKSLSHLIKPLSATFVATKLEDYEVAGETPGCEGLIYIKPLVEIIRGESQFDAQRVVEHFVSKFGIKCTPQTNKGIRIDMIGERNGEKFAIIVERTNNKLSTEVTDKGIENLKPMLEILGVDKVMGFTLDGDNSSLKEFCEETGGIYMDNEDLLGAANIIDNKESFTEAQYNKAISRFPISPSFSKEVAAEGYEEELPMNKKGGKIPRGFSDTAIRSRRF